MSDYPRMLLKYPGPVQLQDGGYDTRVVVDANEHQHAKGEGWCDSTGDAKAAGDKPKEAPKPETKDEPQAEAPLGAKPEDKPATREELLALAEAVGLRVKSNWSDATLKRRIEEAAASKPADLIEPPSGD